MIVRACSWRILLAILLGSTASCSDDAPGPSAQIDVCGRGDRAQLASDLAGGTLGLTFRSADGQVLLLREAAADRPETLPLALPPGTAFLDVEGLSDLGVVVARGTGAVIGDEACVCIARTDDYDLMCRDVSCRQAEGSCSFFDPLDPQPCQSIGREETILDNGTPCVSTGGTPAFLRQEDLGFGGSLQWTNTTADPTIDNFVRWDLHFETAGLYRIEAFTPPEFGVATNARYQVAHASYLTTAIVDQSASDEWNLVGDFEFDAGGVQFVLLGDNAGEPVGIHIAFDALRVTPL